MSQKLDLLQHWIKEKKQHTTKTCPHYVNKKTMW